MVTEAQGRVRTESYEILHCGICERGLLFESLQLYPRPTYGLICTRSVVRFFFISRWPFCIMSPDKRGDLESPASNEILLKTTSVTLQSKLCMLMTMVFYPRYLHKPLVRYIKLRVANAPGTPGTFSPPPRVSDPGIHHGTCVTQVSCCMPGSLNSDFLWIRWRGKCSRHSRRMRNPQFYVSGERPIHCYNQIWVPCKHVAGIWMFRIPKCLQWIKPDDSSL